MAINTYFGFRRRVPLLIFSFGYSYLLPTGASFLVSFLVVKAGSMALWGQYVYMVSIVALGSLVSNWGGKELMIREFSTKPSALVQVWRDTVWSRIIFAFIGGGLFYLFFPNPIAGSCHLWLVFLILTRQWEVWYSFQKSFVWLNVAEIIFWLIILGYVFLVKSFDMNKLCMVTAFSSFVKLVILIVGSRGWGFFFPHIRSIFNRNFFKNGFPFLLLGIVGLAEARLDLFCINYFLDSSSVGRYSIAMSMLMLLKNLPAFFVEPLTKNLYRTKELIKSKLSSLLFITGIFVSLVGVSMVGYVCNTLFSVGFTWTFYLAAMLFVMPRYAFSMDVFLLLQQKNEILMVTGTAIGLLFHLVCNVLFLRQFGIETAMFSAALGQWVMLLFFKYIAKK